MPRGEPGGGLPKRPFAPPDVEGGWVVALELEVVERVLHKARHLVLGPEADRGGDRVEGGALVEVRPAAVVLERKNVRLTYVGVCGENAHVNACWIAVRQERPEDVATGEGRPRSQ